jgi:hypothetical protein
MMDRVRRVAGKPFPKQQPAGSTRTHNTESLMAQNKRPGRIPDRALSRRYFINKGLRSPEKNMISR